MEIKSIETINTEEPKSQPNPSDSPKQKINKNFEKQKRQRESHTPPQKISKEEQVAKGKNYPIKINMPSELPKRSRKRPNHTPIFPIWEKIDRKIGIC